MDNAHKEFQKAIGAAVCRYVPERGVLLAISRHEIIRRHSSMLQEMHFRNLSQKVDYTHTIIIKILKYIFSSLSYLFFFSVFKNYLLDLSGTSLEEN